MIYKLLFVAAIFTIVLYIYINRKVQQRRDEQREKMQERREEMLEKLLQAGKKKQENNEDGITE